MTTLVRWLEHPVTEALGWSLLHFLWQGTLIAVVVAMLLVVMKRSTPKWRYLVLCGGLAVMAACPIATFVWLASSIERPHPPAISISTPAPQVPLQIVERSQLGPMDVDEEEAASSGVLIVAPEPTSQIASTPLPLADRVTWNQRLSARFEPLIPWFVCGWFSGVLALSLRLLGVWRAVRHLRRFGTTAAPLLWQERLSRLAARLRISRTVDLVVSALVEVPTVIGWFKPMILLPAAALTGLTSVQLEALLAHELAHIGRHDYLVNLAQTVIETLLFYHPAVWWVSGRIRQEREHCCDDLAVSLCGDTLNYARALATMEELRGSPMLTLAARGGSLLERVRRVVAQTGSTLPPPAKSSASAGFFVVSLGGLCMAAAIAYGVIWQTEAVLHAEQNSKFDIATESKSESKSDLSDDTSSVEPAMKTLLERLRREERRFQDFSATVRMSRDFQSRKAGELASTASMRTDGPQLSNVTSVNRQKLNGDRFRFVGETITKMSSGKEERSTQTSVCDGTKTLAIYEGGCATTYAGRAEPPLLTPPHTWGMFHLAVSFPLSVYLSGTEAVKLHPKVGRHPREGGSIHEFNKVEAEIVGEETIDDLACTLVLVKRWHYSNDTPVNQYLWLAGQRNLHVVQTRTAFSRNGQETPSEESRVKKWKKVANDLWVPEVVEVIDISPQKQKNPFLGGQKLTVEAAESNPRFPAGTFEFPPIPANLLKFEVADRQLVGSPFHPVVIATPSTTLETILERLAGEETKYDTCEVSSVDRYTHLNSMDRFSGAILASETRERSLRSGNRRFSKTTRSSTESSGVTSNIDLKTDDGHVRRFYYKTVSQPKGEIIRSNATIALDQSRFQISVSQAHTLIFRDGRESQSTLTEFLGSGWYDKVNNYPMTVEYLGDERIGELLCHKLKCNLQQSYFHIWLARDRNLIPIRHESHEPNWNATLPTGVSFAEDLREVRSGVWFPHRITNVAFQKFSQDGLAMNRVVLQWRHDVTVEQATLKPAVENGLFSDVIVQQGTSVDVYDQGGQHLGKYSQSATGRLDVSSEKLQELREQAKASQEVQPAAEPEAPRKPPTRDRGDTPAARLLDRLEQQNGSGALFKDSWTRTLKDIVDLGTEAVPELIEELDATDNDRMLRCLGFTLRAIGDRRAVPALIRAVPRTLRKPGSDMGLNAYDPELFKFAKQHELDPNGNQKYFGFGRPVREICGALQKLTGQQFNEQAVFGVFLSRLPPEWRQKREQYYQVAKTWADWWEANWAEVLDDEAYAKVNLKPLSLSAAPRPEAVVETVGEKSGLILESVLNPDSKKVFYDVDTDRFAELPEKWRTSGDIKAHVADILTWAQQEGFDLMGTEFIAPTGGKPVFALRAIGSKAWELNPDRWKTERNVVTLDSLRQEGSPIAGWLLRRDPKKKSQIADPQATASFLLTTAEGTPALLHVGVEVQDTRQKPGTFFQGHPELNPVAATKGRRFALMYLAEIEERP